MLRGAERLQFCSHPPSLPSHPSRAGWAGLTREDLAHAALQRQRHDLAPALPQLVRNAVHLDGVEALEVQQRLAVGAARGVLRQMRTGQMGEAGGGQAPARGQQWV